MRVGHRAALPLADAAPLPPAPAGGFDPGAHTVAEVVAYATEHPDELDAIYTAEVDGKARSTLLAQLEAMDVA